MPFNGTGIFQRIYSWVNDAANDINVDATRMDNDTNDIADGLSNCITRDGQSVALANLPMGGYKFTGLGAGSAASDSVSYGQVFNSPAFVTPTATTSPASSDNSLRLATTSFVQQVAFSAALPAQPGTTTPAVLRSISGSASWGEAGIKGANIASAANINLTTATGDLVHITGTTPITGITIPVGAERTIIFDAVLTLTHSAALLLPGAINITTAAGDRAIVRGDTAGAVVVNYTRADAVPLNGLRTLHVREEQPSGTNGGNAVGADITQTRTLNTVKANTIPGASLAANTITLPAGTYDAMVRAPCRDTNTGKAFLYNVTDATYVLVGSNAYAGGATSGADSIAAGRFTLTSTKSLTVRHYTANASATTGLGVAVSSGQVEVYAEVIISKVQ